MFIILQIDFIQEADLDTKILKQDTQLHIRRNDIAYNVLWTPIFCTLATPN